MADPRFKAALFDVDGTLYPQSFFIKTSLRFFLQHPRLSVAFRRLRKDIRQIGGVEDLHLAQASLCAGYLRIPADRAQELLETYIYGTYMDMLTLPFDMAHTKEEIIAHLKEMEEHQFEGITPDEQELCIGLFGRDDDRVHGYDDFMKYYTHAQWFDGGHRLNDKIVSTVVEPIITDWLG